MRHRTFDSPILGIYDAAVELVSGGGNLDELRAAVERAETAVRESTCREYAVELYDVLKELHANTGGNYDAARHLKAREDAELLFSKIERKP